MAIVKCPECRKQISSQAKICSHCGYAYKDASTEDLEQAERIARLKHKHRAQMIVYASMLLFLIGTLFFYFGKQMNHLVYLIIGVVGLVVGGVGYIWSRIHNMMLKKGG